jgi:hypothetical protein
MHASADDVMVFSIYHLNDALTRALMQRLLQSIRGGANGR